MNLRERVKRAQACLDDQRVAVALIILAGLLVRVFMCFGSTAILWPDSFDYYYEGASIAATGSVQLHQLYHTPGYPLFLAVFLYFGRTPAIGALVILAQRVLSLCALVFIYRMARRAFGPAAAFWSTLLFALHTLMLYYETVVQTEALFVFGLNAALYYFFSVLDRPAPLRWLLFGALAGWLTLIRPVAQLWAAVAIVVVWLQGGSIKTRFRAGVLVLGGFFLAVLPWMAVNREVYGFWGIARAQGLTLFLRAIEVDGLGIRPDTAYPPLKKIFEKERQKKQCRAPEKRAPQWVYYQVRDRLVAEEHRTFLEADRLMSGIALETIAAHPWEYAANSLAEVGQMLANRRNSMQRCRVRFRVPYLCCVKTQGLKLPPFPNKAREGSRRARWVVTRYFKYFNIPMGAVSALALAGAIMLFTRRARLSPQRLMLLLTILYFVLLTCAMHVPEDRYRLPVDALIFMYAVWAVGEAGRSVRSGRRRPA